MKVTADSIISIMNSWIGYSRNNQKHRIIIDLYNTQNPLPRGYKVQYNDEYCDTTITAAFYKANALDMLGGGECGVERHVSIFKQKGIWIEDGTIVPKRGDIIVYNWDSSAQPNDGWADHIGIIESVAGNSIKTIEGNINGAVAKRTITVGNKYIRGYARPDYAVAKTNTTNQRIDIVARDVIAGKYGNGEERKKTLTAMGYDYSEVQKAVNAILQNGIAIDLTEVALDVIAGKYGNGEERKKKIEAIGLNYSEVQAKVNALLK